MTSQPPRKPTPVVFPDGALDRLRTAVHIVLSFHLLAWGTVYLLGPDAWSSTSSFEVLRSVAPIRVLAAGIVAVGLFFAATKGPTGHALAAIVCLGWTIGVALSAFNGQLSAAGGLSHTATIAVIHLLLMRIQIRSHHNAQ